MSFLPHPPMLSAPNVGSRPAGPTPSHQTNDGEIRTSVSIPSSPVSMFPFPGADARAFSARIPELASALYGLPYTSNSPLYAGLQGVDPTAAYQPILGRINHKEISNQWRSQVAQSPLLTGYDPSIASLVYQGGYGSLALNDGGRRKNATRESTGTLKAWLNEHRKNPYPTKGEKIMLAIVSKMTLTQVSTWFANARRRLKKENRMTWSPRNRCGDDRNSDDDEMEQDKEPGKASQHFDDRAEPEEARGKRSPEIQSHHSAVAPLPSNSGDTSEEEGTSQQSPCFPSNLSYNHIHTQLFLRHLASLPPHLRPTDPMKHFQQQLQQQINESLQRAHPEHSSSPHSSDSPKPDPGQHSLCKEGFGVVKSNPVRRSSISSPTASASSFDRSPSPASARFNFIRDPPVMDRGTPYLHTPHMRRIASNSSPGGVVQPEKHSMLVPNDPRDSQRGHNSCSSEKKKFKIWSPVNLAEPSRKSPPNAPAVSEPSHSEAAARSQSSEDACVQRPSVFSFGDSRKSSYSSPAAGPELKMEEHGSPERSLSPDSAPPSSSSSASEKFSSSWMEEYHRHLAYRNLTAKTQHALATTLATLAANRRNNMHGGSMSTSEALALMRQQQQHAQNLNIMLPDMFKSSSGEAEQRDDVQHEPNEEEDDVFSDSGSNTPMNLSKNSKPATQRTDERPYKIDEEGHKRIIRSIVAN